MDVQPSALESAGYVTFHRYSFEEGSSESERFSRKKCIAVSQVHRHMTKYTFLYVVTLFRHQERKRERKREGGRKSKGESER